VRIREVTLRADYMGHVQSDQITIRCHSVVELPAVHEDAKSADGSVMRTVLEHTSLLIQGADIDQMAKISWVPNRICFRDAISNSEYEFAGSLSDTDEQDTIKFAIDYPITTPGMSH